MIFVVEKKTVLLEQKGTKKRKIYGLMMKNWKKPEDEEDEVMKG